MIRSPNIDTAPAMAYVAGIVEEKSILLPDGAKVSGAGRNMVIASPGGFWAGTARRAIAQIPPGHRIALFLCTPEGETLESTVGWIATSARAVYLMDGARPGYKAIIRSARRGERQIPAVLLEAICKVRDSSTTPEMQRLMFEAAKAMIAAGTSAAIPELVFFLATQQWYDDYEFAQAAAARGIRRRHGTRTRF